MSVFCKLLDIIKISESTSNNRHRFSGPASGPLKAKLAREGLALLLKQICQKQVLFFPTGQSAFPAGPKLSAQGSAISPPGEVPPLASSSSVWGVSADGDARQSAIILMLLFRGFPCLLALLRLACHLSPRALPPCGAGSFPWGAPHAISHLTLAAHPVGGTEFCAKHIVFVSLWDPGAAAGDSET